MNNNKPFAPSADRNKDAILEVLRKELSADERVLEYGSGTGQHACHFAQALPGICWQPSDMADKLPGIQQWINDADCSNVLPPIEIDLAQADKPLPVATACYSANTLHIINQKLVELLFTHAAKVLPKNGKLIIYGPFRFDGQHISPGNEAFDQKLNRENPGGGIRDVTELDHLATLINFSPARIIPMPSNNHLLIWEKCR